jgi:hypothetical protein
MLPAVLQLHLSRIVCYGHVGAAAIFRLAEILSHAGNSCDVAKEVTWSQRKMSQFSQNKTNRYPNCAFGRHSVSIILFLILCHFMSIHVFDVISCHIIHVKSYHSCWIMSFVSNHVIRVKSCHSCQIMAFMWNHAIHIISRHACHIMAFLSNLVIHVKSCHSFQIMSFV